MREKPYNVLFVCTGNSARSILAEALLNDAGKGSFHAWSAGSHPTGTVNSLALDVLTEMHVSAGTPRSKNWEEFAEPGAPQMDFIFTVCDSAAGEACPYWPGKPATAHWAVPDPAAAQGTEEERRQGFRDAAATLRRRIDLMLSLPTGTLDGLHAQGHLRDIGSR